MTKLQEHIAQCLSLTKENIENLTPSLRTYKSGRQIMPGDEIFIGALLGKIDKNGDESIEIIRFHEDEINTIYKVEDSEDIKGFVRLKKI